MPRESKNCTEVFDAREIRGDNKYSSDCDEHRAEIVYISAVDQHNAAHDKRYKP